MGVVRMRLMGVVRKHKKVSSSIENEMSLTVAIFLKGCLYMPLYGDLGTAFKNFQGNKPTELVPLRIQF